MAVLMKGHVFEKYAGKVKYPVYAELKYDEIRCRVWRDEDTVHFDSYAERPLKNLERFAPAFLTLFDATGFNEFDCGFECNGNFNDSYRYVRSNAVPADLVDKPTVFYLFDLPELANLPFFARKLSRDHVYFTAQGMPGYAGKDKTLNLQRPVGKMWDTENELLAYYYTAVTDYGVEGLMVKDLHGVYCPGKRTRAWLKLKPEETADGVILDAREAISEGGAPLGRAGSVLVRVPDEDDVKKYSYAWVHGMKHELATEIWTNLAYYRGRWLEFRYMERDRAGGYRHPTFRRLRESK